jgi:hypothetical protein
MKAIVRANLQEMNFWREKMKAWPEKHVEISEETEVVAEHQKVPNREATLETITALGFDLEASNQQWDTVTHKKCGSREMLYKETDDRCS